MKKRIGNDITFVWTVQRKNGEQLTPEDFTGKECVVKLFDKNNRECTLSDITFATGMVTFTFKGKDQQTIGNYIAVLYENQGEDEMVTVDKVKAVTLVAHSYMEDDEECPCGTVEAESVEIESEISTGGSSTPIDAYTKDETDALLAEKANREYIDEHKGMTRNNETTEFYNFDLLWRAYLGSWGLTLSRGANTGVIIYDGKLKVNDEAVAMASDLAGKQDTISDLDSIRSGASAGATAVQPADLAPIDDRLDDVEYCLGDYINEIYTFNKDNVSEVTTEPVYTTQTLYTTVIVGSSAITCDCKLSADSQSFRALWLPRLYGISNPGRIVFTKSGKATIYLVLRTSLSPAPSPYDVYLNVYDALDNVVMTVYSRDLVYNSSKICTAFTCDVANGYYIKVLYGDSQHAVWLGQIDLESNEVKQISTDVHANSNAIAAIEQKIPSQASSSNQLADKGFVNSSVATATATYRGSYNLVSDLLLSVSATQQQIADALATKMEALSITPDNNDYCFVQIPTADATPTEIARIDRYKYDGTAWAYEYSLNNSSFTAAQWAALNSGITSGLVAKLSDLPTATELATLLAGKASTQQLANKEDVTPIEAVASGTTAINAAVNTYYEVAGEVGTLAITLPVPTDLTKVSMVVVHLTAGTTPNVVIGSAETIDYSAAYDISASKEYEINCLFNGGKWVVADMEVV